MIADVLIQNFKCFDKLTIPEFGRVTLIGGRNNVGKTTLLESLFLFLDRMRADMILRQYGWRGIEGIAIDPEVMWAPVFHNYDMEKSILVSVTMNGAREDMRITFNPDFVLPSTKGTQLDNSHEVSTNEERARSSSLDIKYTGPKGHVNQLSHLSFDTNGQPLIHVEHGKGNSLPGVFLAARKHTSSRETTNRFSKFVKQGRESEVVRFLKIIEPRLETLKIVTEGPSSLVHGKLRGASRTREIHLMGEGMEKLLNLILAIAGTPKGCVFLDEVENGLHYSGLSDIWRAVGNALTEYDCQLFTTTHSKECLEAAHKGLADVADDFRYVRLEQRGEEIRANISNHEMVGAALSSDLEMR